MDNYRYSGICHTPCYWKETLWVVGDVYEGNDPPNKHFSESGVKDPSTPPPNAGSDKRSNKQLRAALKKHPYNFTAPGNWSRKKVWQKLHDLESSAEKDALTTDDMPAYEAACGFIARAAVGMAAHERSCEKCKEIKNGNTGSDLQPGA